MTSESIQLLTLALLAERKGGHVLRSEIAKLTGVTGAVVDRAMSPCGLVRRITSNGGHHIRFCFAD